VAAGLDGNRGGLCVSGALTGPGGYERELHPVPQPDEHDVIFSPNGRNGNKLHTRVSLQAERSAEPPIVIPKRANPLCFLLRRLLRVVHELQKDTQRTGMAILK